MAAAISDAMKSPSPAYVQAYTPLPKNLPSHRDVIAFYNLRYHSLIESGEARPFLYPWAAAGALLVLISLLIDYRRSRDRERVPRLGTGSARPAGAARRPRATGGGAMSGKVISRRPSEYRTSFPIEELEVELPGRERSKIVVLRSDEKNTPSSSCEPRGTPPPCQMILVTLRANPWRGSSSRGSCESVITAVLLVAKISASGSPP